MHLVQTMAYAGEVPWHGLGNQLSPHQPLEVWAHEAGMDWTIEEATVRYVSSKHGLGSTHAFPAQKVLFRSDTQAPLSVVSNRYQVVQPAEVLEFYRDLTEIGGYRMETAGVLKEGRKFWALARTGQTVSLKGDDKVDGYLLLATACDGTMATTAQFTSIRVVCNNTLSIALGDGAGAVKVPHRSQFNADAVKQQLGVAVSSWDSFIAGMKALSERKVSAKESAAYFQRVLTNPIRSVGAIPTVNESALKQVHMLFEGAGKGALLPAASGTAWGMLNSITEFVDHYRRARSDDNRRDSAWFGPGEALKSKAWNEALKLII